MLTQAIPSVVRALSGSLPPAALKQLTQALGNCGQSVAQRGDVTVQPSAWTNVTNFNGTYGDGSLGGRPGSGGSWNPAAFSDLLKNIGSRQNIDATSTANYTSYGDQLFDFSVKNSYPVSRFYGGDSVNIGGSTVWGDTFINNPPGINGRDGRDGTGGKGTSDGTAGEDGEDGASGGGGPSGAAGSDGFNGISVQGPAGPAGAVGGAGQNGIAGRDGANGGMGIPGFGGAIGRPDQQLVVTNVTQRKKSVQALAGVTFDPETCELQYAFVNIDYVEDATGEKQLIRFFAP